MLDLLLCLRLFRNILEFLGNRKGRERRGDLMQRLIRDGTRLLRGDRFGARLGGLLGLLILPRRGGLSDFGGGLLIFLLILGDSASRLSRG